MQSWAKKFIELHRKAIDEYEPLPYYGRVVLFDLLNDERDHISIWVYY
jgi:hypothetical protein